jgi:hypothetical protein
MVKLEEHIGMLAFAKKWIVVVVFTCLAHVFLEASCGKLGSN